METINSKLKYDNIEMEKLTTEKNDEITYILTTEYDYSENILIKERRVFTDTIHNKESVLVLFYSKKNEDLLIYETFRYDEEKDMYLSDSKIEENNRVGFSGKTNSDDLNFLFNIRQLNIDSVVKKEILVKEVEELEQSLEQINSDYKKYINEDSNKILINKINS